MSGRGHIAGAALGLVGLVGASALAGVTSLHVDLEHGLRPRPGLEPPGPISPPGASGSGVSCGEPTRGGPWRQRNSRSWSPTPSASSEPRRCCAVEPRAARAVAEHARAVGRCGRETAITYRNEDAAAEDPKVGRRVIALGRFAEDSIN